MSILFIIVMIAIIFLQIYFSKFSKKLGLILPVLSFLFSIGFCIWFVFYGTSHNICIVTLSDGSSFNFETVEEADKFISSNKDKKVVSFNKISDEGFRKTQGGYFLSVAKLFFISNIRTLILLAIYFYIRIFRKKYGKFRTC